LPPRMPIPSKKTDLEVLLLITFIYHLWYDATRWVKTHPARYDINIIFR
jgi:hypothetical protein